VEDFFVVAKDALKNMGFTLPINVTRS